MNLSDLSNAYIKRFGTPHVASDIPKIEVLPTDLIDLDSRVLGIGGFPRGRLVELFGRESGGKSSLAQHLVGQTQRDGGICAWMDIEGCWDNEWAERLGVDPSSLIFPGGDFAEDYLDQIRYLVSELDLIVVDSLAALNPKIISQREEGKEPRIAGRALMMSQFCVDLVDGTKATPKLRDTKCCVVFINQIRERVGVVYGEPEDTPGGRALKHNASLRMDIRRIGIEKDENRQKVRVKVVKSKVGPPLREWTGYLSWDGKFIEHAGNLLDLAKEKGLVEMKGAGWIWILGTEDKVQGAENFRKYCEENSEFYKKVLN